MSADEPSMGTEGGAREEPTTTTRLSSRIFVTWVELVAVGFLGAIIGGFSSGPPQLVVYLATVLTLVAVFMYNVDRLVTSRIQQEE